MQRPVVLDGWVKPSSSQFSNHKCSFLLHPFSGLTLFRRYVGGRWEKWTYASACQDLDSLSFWVHTGTDEHTTDLQPSVYVKVEALEVWSPRKRHH